METQKTEKGRRANPSQKIIIGTGLATLIIGAITFLISRSIGTTLIISISILTLTILFFSIQKKLRQTKELKKMEEVFPDFIALMASNLRAGITIDKALLLSSRKEFSPLDQEILRLGKDIIAGKEITHALRNMGERIQSEEIKKTILLISSGIISGGNISILLEETAVNMRERIFVQKRAASNVLMYVIFIFFAVAVGAPILFGLSSVLVSILSALFADLPIGQANINLPFTLTKLSVSPTFIMYFSLSFIIAIDILASLVVGLVSKGKEREGLKYVVPLIICSTFVYLVSRTVLLSYFADFFK